MTPTDHFAPRDFLSVIDNEFLPVTGVRASVQWRSESLEGVWVPFFTPSRTPLLNQRWTVVPEGAESLSLVDASGPLPEGSQAGVRWGHTTGAVRRNGHGAYVKGEYSQARGQHWRATVTGALIRGHADDFLGQYRRNSHVTLSIRYSF